MTDATRRNRVRRALAAPLVGTALLLAGSLTAPGTAPASARSSVDVLYAGSLVNVMQNAVAPAFAKATGDTMSGISAGSDELASEIKAKTQRADVFVSASPRVNAKLAGRANGNWVSWYATFASSALVLAYNPHGHFAAALRTKPWWTVVSEPGFRLGRTDASVDPKGKLADEALTAASDAHHVPALRALEASSASVYPEQTLVGRLQAGQLDAGFFYAVEAKAARLPTVPLTGTHLGAHFTITLVNRAPDGAAGQRFIAYLLGPAGRRILQANGLVIAHPVTVTGRKAAVPAGLRGIFSTA